MSPPPEPEADAPSRPPGPPGPPRHRARKKAAAALALPSASRIRGLAALLALVVAAATWHYWPKEKRHYMVPPSSGQFDHAHAAWRPVLAELTASGSRPRPDEAALRAQHEAVRRYLRALSAVTPPQFTQWSHSQQTAFLLNLYQAAVLDVQARKVAASQPPVLRDGWRGDFSPRLVRFNGRLWSLREVEKDWLTKNASDPRAAAALYRGTEDSPPLRAEPFTAARLDAQLAEAVKNSSSGN